ncbi:MAG TPA: Spy/CpxP family protein refolding chaperone [Bryobacteraceae bacterium]|nr:Spy/CpxP family protein refolding chaperone [Bryobacteraceae bacterium]
MKQQLIKIAAVTALAAGMVFADAPASNPSTGSNPVEQGRHHFRRDRMQRVAQQLNLTDAQKTQAKEIFQQARENARPLRQELKENREALRAAVKAGKSEADLQKLSANQGQLLGQMVTIRSEAAAQFYKILTPEQRAKADQMHQQFKQRIQSRQNRHNG